MEVLESKYKNFVGIETAAKILGVSIKTAKRYVDKYNLRNDGYELINEGDLNDLKESLDVCKKRDLSSVVKQFFILEKEDLTVHEIINACKYLGKGIVGKALHAFDFYSNNYRIPFFTRFGLDPDDYFLPGEVLSRLRIGDFHAIKNLAEEGSLNIKVLDTGKRAWNYIYRDSFLDFVETKNIKGKAVFLSSDISELTGISVNRIDKIALANDIGVKLRRMRKSSIYLFTIEDFHAIREYDRSSGVKN